MNRKVILKQKLVSLLIPLGVLLLFACNLRGESKNATPMPTVMKHAYYQCAIDWSRDQREQTFIFYTLECFPEKTATLQNVRVYMRRINKKSRRKTTHQMDTFLPQPLALSPKQQYKVSGRLEARVRNTYQLELVATGDWRWPGEKLADEVADQTRQKQETVIDPTKYTFGLIKQIP